MKWMLSSLSGKDVVFVGAGRGRALSDLRPFLEKYSNLKSFTAVDKDEQHPDNPLGFLSNYDPDQTYFIKNEGIPGIQLPVPYITPLQLFFQLVQQTGARTIGITGSKGKSTTTALTAHILTAAGLDCVLAGNIGRSPFSYLDTATSQTIFVMELSSYQLSDLTMPLTIAACLNLYNDHLDWHGSVEAYWEAKHNIIRGATPDTLFLYNVDFEVLRDWAKTATGKTLAIDANEPLSLERASLFGEQNRMNARFARQIGRSLGLDDALIQSAIESFQPLDHRMQTVITKNKRTYIDDAIGMTPESTIASINAITEQHGPIGCLFLGGQDRGYDFSTLVTLIAGLKIDSLVLFPDTGPKIKMLLPANYKPSILETSAMTEAVTFAAAEAPENSVVLLSTAAPSYVLWSGFEEKGEQFQTAIRALP